MATSAPSRQSGTNNTARPASVYEEVPANGASSKQAKRRSLLPQFARKLSEEREPPSAISEDDVANNTESTKEAAQEARKAMPPPSIPTRVTSIRTPGSSMIGRSPSVRSHAYSTSRDRKGSLETPTSTSQSSADISSQQRPPSSLGRTDSKRVPPSPGKRGVPASKATHNRTISTAKPPAISTATLPQPSVQPAQQSPTNSSMPRPTSSRSHIVPPSRPAFSTYQQHFSPAKSSLPKPPIPAAKAVKRPGTADEADAAMVFDITKDQVELLQLSLLHQAAGETTREFDASAKRVLKQRHARLRKELDSVKTTEQDRRILTNLAEVEAWCPDADLLAEHLQTLSRVVTDLRTFTEQGSRYFSMTETFETWATNAESALLDERDTSGLFIEPLPEMWRAMHTSLALKLRSIHRDFDMLPPAPSSGENDEDVSSLEIVLDACSVLVKGLLRELEMMTKLQKEALLREKTRVDEQVKVLCADRGAAHGTNSKDWVPAWQTVE